MARRATVVVALTLICGLMGSVPGAAASSGVPSDVRLVSTWTDPLTGYQWDRYQQYAAPLNVFVDGGQLVVVRAGGHVVDEGGSYFPGLRVANAPRLSPTQAVSGADGSARSTQLRVDPKTGRQFYRVTTSAPGSLLYQDIDANTGALMASWSGIENDAPGPGEGTGVKGDTKTLAGDAWTGAGVLTKGNYQMFSADGRFVVSDANNTTAYPSAAITDSDNVWESTRQRAAVDAQYYAALTDNFYKTKFGLEMTTMLCPAVPDPQPLGPIHSIVHYRNSYDNAFWDPSFKVMVYGDGNGSTDGQFSGAQDVVSHELSHAVTTCHADLDYIKESGALNEAFSDIMAATAEFELEEPISSNCIREAGQSTCADWWLAEDAIIGGSDHAFRSMANPGLLHQPAHYADRVSANTPLGNCNSFNDYCGVHYNSGIANHAFYLLAHGGRNARCAGPTDPKADCDVVVPGIGLDHASHIFLNAWFDMTNTSNFCDARTKSIEQAQMLVDAPVAGYAQADVSATELAWDAVGVYCPPGSATFSVAAASRSTAAKPGGSTSVTLNISRTGSTNPISFSVSDTSPATPTFTPPTAPNGTTSSSLQLDVPGGATPGSYLLTITADDGADIQHVPVVLIIDGDNPQVSVTDVQMNIGTTVATDGHAPLNVVWDASDSTSGVAAGTLVVDSTPLGSSPTSPSLYSSTDGSHAIQVQATDLAGNNATSTPLNLTRTSTQETPSASLVYAKAWTNATTGTAWGNTRYSKTKGATAIVTFTGTDIAWVSTKAPKRGKAKVYIDGVQKAVIDLKSATTARSVIVYVASGLSAGQHTLKIYVNATSGRPRVDVDGFIVLSI